MKRLREEQSQQEPDQSKRPEENLAKGMDHLVHFIWAGGDTIMNSESVEIVRAWAEANKDFNIIIWVDARALLSAQTDENKLEMILMQYQDALKKFGIDVFLDQIPSDYAQGDKKSAPIVIRDITQHRLINDYIRYEIDKVEPNYGSSSDLLRYHILERYGAAYADSDVGPGENSLLSCQLFTEPPQCHQLYLDHVSQRVNPPEVCMEHFELFYPVQIHPDSTKTFQPIPGNDSFICTPGNPLMKEIIRCTEDNYQLPKLNDMGKFIMAAYGGADIPRQTIDRTGTTPVQTVLSASKPLNISGDYYEMSCLDQRVQVLPLRHVGLKLMQPVKNTRLWIKRVDWKGIDKELLIDRLVYQTLHEIKFFGVLRLCDHTAFLRTFARMHNENPEKWVEEYYSKIEKSLVSLDDVKIAQLVSLDSFVQQFYDKHHLFEKTHILRGSGAKDFQEICDLVTSKDKLIEIVSNIKRFSKEYIDGVYNSSGDLNQLYTALNMTVDFIELLISKPEKFQRMMSGEMLVSLENVKIIATSFSEKFKDAGCTFDFDRVEKVLIDCKKDPKVQDEEDARQLLKMYMSAEPDRDAQEPYESESGSKSKGVK